MKIIGHTNEGYLVTVSGWEIGRINGDSINDHRLLPVDTVIEIDAAWKMLAAIRRYEADLKLAGANMAALGTMLQQNLPSFVIEPPRPAPTGAVEET